MTIAILRAMVARAICAVGLHASFGVHHEIRYNAFCLADDLMEPFRPVVDRVAALRMRDHDSKEPVAREVKAALIEPLLSRYVDQCESRTLFDLLARAASSLAKVLTGEVGEFELPVI